MKITIVYLEHEMLLTKKQYQSWMEVQNEFDKYKTSLGPWSAKEVVDYLLDEYPNLKPSAEVQVSELVKSSNEISKVTFNA